MAEPARIHPDPSARDPHAADPMMPITNRTPERRFEAANDPRVDQRAIIAHQSGRAGSGVKLAFIVLIVAAAAYLLFAPGAQAPIPAEPPASTAPEAGSPATAPTQPVPATQP